MKTTPSKEDNHVELTKKIENIEAKINNAPKPKNPYRHRDFFVVTGQVFKKIIEKRIRKIDFSHIISFLASLLVLIILIGFLGGIVKTFIDLRLLISQPMDVGIKQMLVNVLTLLAVIEVIKTAMSYLSDGRVRVTYIVDTVLILMLNEVISFWYSGDHTAYIPMLATLLTLIVIRILTIKFSPSKYSAEE